jgi:hypothetical protein
VPQPGQDSAERYLALFDSICSAIAISAAFFTSVDAAASRWAAAAVETVWSWRDCAVVVIVQDPAGFSAIPG